MSRPTTFELRIRPLFRELDREHMLLQRDLDLWDPSSVRAYATTILSVLETTQPSSTMPPIGYGGPWPPEWINLFKQWVAEGYPNLELGSASQYEAQRSGDLVALFATITRPAPEYAVWPDRYFGPAKPGGMPDVVLYQERRDAPPPVVTEEGVGIFRFPTTVAFLRVLDATGVHTVTITAAADMFRQRLAPRGGSR